MQLISYQIEQARQTVRENVGRIAKLGEWPAWIDGERSLVGRIPEMTGTAPGFDAGIACAMGLIPEHRQELPATLHAAYTQEAVEQVRREMSRDAFTSFEVGTASVWWLAASSLCNDEGVDAPTFIRQLSEFARLAHKPNELVLAAAKEFDRMRSSFRLETYSFGQVPFGTRDGCIQAAYIAGYSFGVRYAEADDTYFIGTYMPALGLDDFKWSDQKDGKGRLKSGPVHGSKQYMMCADSIELLKALQIVCKTLR